MLKNFLNHLKSKNGSVTLETIMVIVVFVLVVVLALSVAGTQIAGTIKTTSNSIDSQTACILKGGIWDAATKACSIAG